MIPGHKIDKDWVDPYRPEQCQPASYDVRLGKSFLEPHESGVIDVRDDVTYHHNHAENDVVINPGECLLATTQEIITLPKDVAAQVEGRSSLGRLFLIVHSTAGFLDPGFKGQVTLELSNMSSNPIRLYVGMRIAQIVFRHTDGPCIPYDGKYQNQMGATGTRIQEDGDV